MLTGTPAGQIPVHRLAIDGERHRISVGSPELTTLTRLVDAAGLGTLVVTSGPGSASAASTRAVVSRFDIDELLGGCKAGADPDSSVRFAAGRSGGGGEKILSAERPLPGRAGRRKRQLTGAASLVADYARRSYLPGFPAAAHQFLKGCVDEALVVADAGLFDLVTESRQNIVVRPDGDSGFGLEYLRRSREARKLDPSPLGRRAAGAREVEVRARGLAPIVRNCGYGGGGGGEIGRAAEAVLRLVRQDVGGYGGGVTEPIPLQMPLCLLLTGWGLGADAGG